MKRYWKRIMSVALTLAMVLPIFMQAGITAKADLGKVISGNKTGGNGDGTGIFSVQFAVGFGICDQEEYSGTPNDDDLYTWVDGYSTRHYVPIIGGAYHAAIQTAPYGDSSAPPYRLTDMGSSNELLQQICAGGGDLLESVGTGRYRIRKDKVDEAMAAIKDANPQMYANWMSDRYAKHPIVIAVEVMIADNRDGAGYTVYDLAQYAGCADTLLSAPQSMGTMTVRYNGTAQASTAKLIHESCKGQAYARGTVFSNMFASFFGCYAASGNLADSSLRYAAGYAGNATGGANGSDIFGCYVISAGGLVKGTTTTKNEVLFGSYDWDFDAERIPKNPVYEEDGTARIGVGESVDAYFKFGYVNPACSSAGTWRSYGSVYGSSEVKLELELYSVGVGRDPNGIFTTDISVLEKHPGPTAQSVVSGLQSTYTYTMPWEEFCEVLDGKYQHHQGVPFDGMSGNGMHEVQLSGSAKEQGFVGVSYYTKLYVTPMGGSGPQDGKRIRFSCDTTHTAQYTPVDGDRTYKLQQTGLKGWSQLKDDAIGAAQFEAQAGTPTTEDMFISMGGSEFLVNMQYVMHVDDYKRTYDVHVDPYANYLYYEASDGLPRGEKRVPGTYKNQPTPITIIQEPSAGDGSNDGSNQGFVRHSNAAAQQQYATFKQEADKYHDALETLFAELDSNATENGGVYNTQKEYGVCVLGGKLRLTGDWAIEGIDEAVKGKEQSKVNATKEYLKKLSLDMQLMKKWRDDKSKFEDRHAYSKFTGQLKVLQKETKVVFFDLVEDWKDYDSNADCSVVITFIFQPRDTVDYKEVPKEWANYDYLICQGQEDTHCGSSNAGTHNKTECQEYIGVTANETVTGCSGYTDGCNNKDSDGDGVNDSCGGHTCNGKTCTLQPDDKHKHYGHQAISADYQDHYEEEVWNPDGVKHDVKHTPKEEWSAKIIRGIDIDYEAGGYYVARKSDGDRGKMLSYDATLEQIYKSVKYMDIIEAHVWRLGGGAASDMTDNQLMCPVTDTKAIEPVIEMACNNLGFTLYTTSPAKCQPLFARTLNTADGKTYQNVWTSVDKAFADTLEKDPLLSGEPKYGANTELQAIGRLANSYNPGSSEEHQFFADGKEGREDVMRVTGTGDNLSFTYNIEEQGGRSHWSFDGFLKQAIANTFYDGMNKAGGAYRNYIIVQSDFLALQSDSGYFTLSGMQLATKSIDVGNGTFSVDGNYGLTQAILCSNESYDASDLYRYCTKGTPWKKIEDLKKNDSSVNENMPHQEGAVRDVKAGSGPRDTSISKSQPSAHTAQLVKYAEGPDKGNYEGEYAKAHSQLPNASFVMLDKNATYGGFTLPSMVGSAGFDGTIAQWSNFSIEGKQGGGDGNSLNFTGDPFPLAGYVGKQDSVLVNEHNMKPQGGGSTTFTPETTLVTSMWSGASFPMYGCNTHTTHLHVAKGGSAVATKKVSAPGSNEKNRVSNAGSYFPYYTGLNVTRWLPNSQYDGATTALYYDEALSLMEPYLGVESVLKETYDKLNNSTGTVASNETYIKSDLKQQGPFEGILSGEGSGISNGNHDILTHVGYAGAGSDVTNDVVIFNPSTTEHTDIIDVSDDVPDGTNSYRDKDTREGFTKRNQRVSETTMSATDPSFKETFSVVKEYNPGDIVDVTTETIKIPKDRSTYPTEAYAEADYINTEGKTETWTVNPGEEGLTVSKTGTYRMSVYDEATKDTSVELKLQSGDTLTTDGTSVYLSRVSDNAPVVSYDTLADSVARYYLMNDELRDAAKEELQYSFIQDKIKEYSSIVEGIDEATDLIDFDWTLGPDYDPVGQLTDAVILYNTVVDKYNTAVRTSKLLNYNGINYSIYSESGVSAINSLMSEVAQVRAKIETEATRLEQTVSLHEPLKIQYLDDPNKPPYEVAEMRENGYYVVCNKSGKPLTDANGVMTFYAPGKYTKPVYGKFLNNTVYSCDKSGNFLTKNIPLTQTVSNWTSALELLNVDDIGNEYTGYAITDTTALTKSEYGYYVVVSPVSGLPLEDTKGVQTFYAPNDYTHPVYGRIVNKVMCLCDEKGTVVTTTVPLKSNTNLGYDRLYLKNSRVTTSYSTGAKLLTRTAYGYYVLSDDSGKPEPNALGLYTHYGALGRAEAVYGKLVDGVMLSCNFQGTLNTANVSLQGPQKNWNGVSAGITLDQNMKKIADRIIKEMLCLCKMDYGYYAVVDPTTLKPILGESGVITHFNRNEYTKPVYGRTDETGTLCRCDSSGKLATENIPLKNPQTPAWFDKVSYNKKVSDQLDEVEKLADVLGVAQLKLDVDEALAVKAQTEGVWFEDDLKEQIDMYNKLITAIRGSWNVQAGSSDVGLSYASGYDELRAFMAKVAAVQSKLNSVAVNNGVADAIVSSTPGVVLNPATGDADSFRGTDSFRVNAGAYMDINLTGLGMSKGSTLVIRIPYDKVYDKPADVELSCNGDLIDFESLVGNSRNQSDYGYTLYEYNDGTDHVYVIESLQDNLKLGVFHMVFNQTMRINQFPGSCVEFDKVWLCDVGTAHADPAYLGTTVEHNHYTSGVCYRGKTSSRSRSINKILFDACGVEATATTNIRSRTLFVSKVANETSTLSLLAIENPHKVPNADWRFYVLGWQTEGGSTIMSVRDRRLWNDSTVLCWPSASSGTITVGELRKTACLVKFGGNLYLTTREAGLQHKILETSMIVPKYDNFVLSDPNTVRDRTVTVEKNYDAFPLKANAADAKEQQWKGYTYEYFFDLLDGAASDKLDVPLFLVEWSENMQYRFKSTETRTFGKDVEAWKHDWDEKEQSKSSTFVAIPGRDAGGSEYISLDDEFDIEFSNAGPFAGVKSHYNADWSDHAALGYGWDANGIKLLGDQVSLGIPELYGVSEDDGVLSEGYIVDGQETELAQTETTGWIYAKWVTFSDDVYVFAKDGKINPTLNAYSFKDGDPTKEPVMNTPVLVPKGYPVYLGEYLSGPSDSSKRVTQSYQADWCNYGGFRDYGAPEATKDKYGDAFVYHFWYPLYNGEQPKDGFKVMFHSVNINEEAAKGNPAMLNPNDYLIREDYNNAGIGKAPYHPGDRTNNDATTTDDKKWAYTAKATSVVGRIGALTIADTGDPRYSDSFKTTDIESDNVEDFLIYPIVRKIVQYMNVDPGSNTKIYGTQRGVVLDPFDVRGRIATDWMRNIVSSRHSDSSLWSNYKLYAGRSYNTYGTQWFKEALVRYERGKTEDSNTTSFGQALPLTPDFNKHDTFEATPVRLGYELYCSLESIGNYYGQSDKFTAGEVDETTDNADTSNRNNDYGKRKVQVRPFYSAVNAVSEEYPEGSEYNGPVDVYMRSGDTYVMINSAADGSAGKHDLSEFLEVMYANYDPNYIETNTGDTENQTDENMNRRMVTPDEADNTLQVLDAINGGRTIRDFKSLLTKVSADAGGIGGKDLEPRYTYGCSQILFLRERNMTYVGGKTAALNRQNPVPDSERIENARHAQKWYFGLGLPSSAVFVPHGEELNKSTMFTKGYIVNSIDVIASGDIWTLQYMSEVSKLKLQVGDEVLTYEEWNHWKEKYPWLVPVTYYDLKDSSVADLDTQGSH